MVLYCEFCEILKNTFLQVAASEELLRPSEGVTMTPANIYIGELRKNSKWLLAVSNK